MNAVYKKWIICAAIGLVLGILLSVKAGAALYLLMGPLYVIGLAYGAGVIFPWFLKTIGALGKASFLAFIASKPLMGLLVLVFIPFALALMLTIGWCVGLVMAIIALIGAVSETIQGSSTDYVAHNSQDDGPWFDGPTLPKGDPAIEGDDTFPFSLPDDSAWMDQPGGETFPDQDDPFL